jgi:hypothetical protein
MGITVIFEPILSTLLHLTVVQGIRFDDAADVFLGRTPDICSASMLRMHSTCSRRALQHQETRDGPSEVAASIRNPHNHQIGETMYTHARTARVVIGVGLLVGLFMMNGRSGLARDKYETIEAQAMGTGTQLGQNIGVTLNIYEFSTPADKQILVEAFDKGQTPGLANALQKMKAVGHVEITGTLGYDCSFIKMTLTPTGRKIVFLTNRQIRMGEAYRDSQSQSFNLTAGIIEINDQEKNKSTGVLYPETQLILNKEGELQWDLAQNPWKLVDVLDWKGTAGVN